MPTLGSSSLGRYGWLLIVVAIAVAATTFYTRDKEPGAPAPQSATQPPSANGRPADDGADRPAGAPPRDEPPVVLSPREEEQAFAQLRARMVAEHMAARDIDNRRVLEVMGRVPRHEFVPDGARAFAYVDSPLSIGHQQTISQPYIVALMTQLADPQPDDKALDIGTGSGYQAAVLAELVDEVYSIEILEPLATTARERLAALGYQNIRVRHGDGYRGWPDEAPFDLIIVAAAPDHVPEPLVEQLAPGGKLVIPVGTVFQNLLVVEKNADGEVSRRHVTPVAFVPMTGEAQQ